MRNKPITVNTGGPSGADLIPFHKSAKVLVVLFAILGLWASPALALQTHGGPEGLCVHQGAHLYFIVSMIFFSISIHRSGLAKKKAWRLFSRGAWLLILWNLWAFSGHIIESFIPDASFSKLPGQRILSLSIASWQEAVYYILKMDHILCFPAVLFFYFGLKSILGEFQKESRNIERNSP